jgi:Fur family ferric uptake transcriptional regulator
MSGLSNEKDYKDLLKKENLRNTKHRNSVLEVIEENGQPVTAEIIFLKLKEQGVSISLSTVYRVLDALLNKGLIIKTSVTDENKALYELNNMEHKHHLLCVKCRKCFKYTAAPEEYEKALEEKSGFSIKGHKLEVYGLCESCKDEEK